MSKVVMGITMEDDRDPVIISRDRVIALYGGKYVFLTQGDEKKALIPVTWCCTPMKDIMERKNGRKLVAVWKVCPYCAAPIMRPEPAEAPKTNGHKKPTSPLLGRVWIHNLKSGKRRMVKRDMPLLEGWDYLRKLNTNSPEDKKTTSSLVAQI